MKDLEYYLAVAKLYKALRETKWYLKTMEIQGHVPIMARHNKIMEVIQDGLSTRKVLFK